MPTFEKIPQSAIDTIRMLSLDAVEKAKSGHPGTPMGAAELTLTLWTYFLRFNPAKPNWQDRDRFVLSAGHASMLLYSLLHLYGYEVTLDELQRFRQLGSKTAGHPEYGHLPGIETTTGPLGQGIGNAVGMALGQALLAGKYNKDGKPLKGRVWCLAGDGCMMEGVSAEASSLAGHLGLNNLVLIYDRNSITIDGSIDLAFAENVGQRYEAYGWQVLEADAYDQAGLCAAFEKAAASTDKPVLIIAKSIIGKGAATKEGTSATHGAALGPEETKATKEKMGWPLEPFHIPAEAKAWFEKQAARKKAEYAEWEAGFKAWQGANADLAKGLQAQFEQKFDGAALSGLARQMAADKAATRKHSFKAIQALAKEMPWLVGGSADLAESNLSLIKDSPKVGHAAWGGFEGRNIYFGVREHAMGAIVNGLALHGAWRPFSATFLQFADYMRPSIRLAALMGIRSIFLFSHDSVLLGEDGPTHQPVEHLHGLRLIPGLTLWRPAEGLETAMAWAWTASEAKGPVVLATSRQNVPVLSFAPGFDPLQVWKGGYVFQEDASASLTLIATGAELGTVVEAAKLLAVSGVKARIVSLPSVCVFTRQDAAYREAVLGSKPRVVVEAGSTALWPAYVGSDSLAIGVDSFGVSAPGEDVAKHFGLLPAQVSAKVLAWMASRAGVKA